MKTDSFIRLLAEDLPSQPDHPGMALARWLLATGGVAGAAFIVLAGARADLLGTGLLPSLMKVSMGVLLGWIAFRGARFLSRPEASINEPLGTLVMMAAFLAVLFASDLVLRGVDGWIVRVLGKSILTCLTVIPAMALLPLAASLYAFRGGATTSPVAAGGLLGLASAGMAIIAYGLFCTEDSPAFVATWYSLAAILVAVLGAALGRSLLRW